MPVRERPPLLEAWEVAHRLTLSRKSVYRLVAKGDLRAIRFNRTLRFDSADVDKLATRGSSR